MDLARNILKKYGWEEGKGLGKNEDGIDRALKPKLKFDTTGLGHDPGKEFTNKWWESAYNSAANNIDVQNKKSKVRIKKNGVMEISTKKNMIWKKQSVEQSDEQDETSQGPSSLAIVQLTDEELFVACGGLTAHKAARHGHKLSGKLKRLQKQEEELTGSLIQVDKSKKDLGGNSSVVDDKEEELDSGLNRYDKKKKKRRLDGSHSEKTCEISLKQKKRKKNKVNKET